MFAQVPTDLNKVKKEDLNAEMLRFGMIAELDAISFYEQMAAMTTDPGIRKVMLDIAKEEKTHAGEFQALLLKIDPQQNKELEAGRREVEELTG